MNNKIVAVSSLFFLYVFTGINYFYTVLIPSSFFPIYWVYELACFAALSFLINIILIFTSIQNAYLKIFFLFFQSLTMVLVSASSGIDLFILCLLVTTYSGQLCFYFTKPSLIQFLIPFCVFIFYLTLPSKLWDSSVVSLSFIQILLLLFFIAFVQGFIFLISYILTKKEKLERQISLFNALLSQIYEINSGIQTKALEAERKSAEAERKRISRDIHDIMGYTLVNLRVMLEAAYDLVDDTEGSTKALLSTAVTHSQTGLQKARKALYNLREYEDPKTSWENNICDIARIFSDATKIEVTVSFGNVTHHECPIMISAVYQFVQETLTNSFKHGDATVVRISFHVENEFLIIRICDNGKGATDEIIEGIGFTGMQERLSLVQGAVLYRNIDDGFEVKCVIPLLSFQKVLL